ncbi:hypothetical protein, partial [Streptomyces sp. NPDC005476]|uniref:hypothetical protein n=1 Tax=Streptomyces sp. NPDC005476 TaxID=3156882 RepID=UPI0034533C8D
MLQSFGGIAQNTPAAACRKKPQPIRNANDTAIDACEQAERVVGLLEKFGLKRGENGLRLVMMCEVPTNAILAEDFLQFFDGFSI